jgi:hypothetical protein
LAEWLTCSTFTHRAWVRSRAQKSFFILLSKFMKFLHIHNILTWYAVVGPVPAYPWTSILMHFLVQGGVQNARYQGICSWMVDPLATDPESPTHFLQCQPAPNNLFCGRWQRMPCAPATKFDVNSQVCVWDSSRLM